MSYDKVNRKKLKFVEEQYGKSEWELKQSLSKLFALYKKVFRVYLCKYIGDDDKPSIALCLVLRNYDQDIGLVDKISGEFARVFKKDQFLDIMFLSEDDEQQIIGICSPFYTNDNMRPDYSLLLEVNDNPCHYSNQYELESVRQIRRCFYIKDMVVGDRIDWELHRVEPSVVFDNGILANHILISTRHMGQTFKDADGWPKHVYVAQILKENLELKYLKPELIVNWKWGMLGKIKNKFPWF